MQEAGPAVLEKPDRQNGEGEQQDEDEQVGAVLPMALLRLLLGHDLLVHGSGRSPRAVQSPGPAKEAHSLRETALRRRGGGSRTFFRVALSFFPAFLFPRSHCSLSLAATGTSRPGLW